MATRSETPYEQLARIDFGVIPSLCLLLVLVGLCVTLPFEVPQLLVAVVGATIYLLRKQPSSWAKVVPASRKACIVGSHFGASAEGSRDLPRCQVGRVMPHLAFSSTHKLYAGQSAQAIAPGQAFVSADFEREVEEFLAQSAPTAQVDMVVQRLAECAKEAIKKILPEVDVAGVTGGDVLWGSAFGMAVPEVHIIASASPHSLIRHLPDKLAKGQHSGARLDARKLQKSAIRACTDVLVAAGFKFRRTAFRGPEPKVTLMAPPSLGAYDKPVPIDFSVNCVMPLYNAALLAECAAVDPRAKALVLLVKRWAKNRGVCHEGKGHLHPYAWTLLGLYFLQVGTGVEQILPPLQGFKTGSGLKVRRGSGSGSSDASAADEVTPRSVARLFAEFVRFYSQDVRWSCEAVAVRLGQRKPANLHLGLHVVEHKTLGSEVAPTIEDPFEPTKNLGNTITASGFERLREEFVRASECLASGSQLSTILEPWVPSCGGAESGDDDEADVSLQPLRRRRAPTW